MNEFIVLKGFRKMGTGWEGMMSEFMTFLSYVGILLWNFTLVTYFSTWVLKVLGIERDQQ